MDLESDFREALAATLAKSQEDRRVFELVFDRFFFRAVEIARCARASARAISRSLEELVGGRARGAARQIAEALRDGAEGPCATSRGWPSPPSPGARRARA